VRAVTVTKEGHRALSYSRSLRPDQATYHGLKKPKEAFHDAELYRLYHKVSDEIESRGGKVVRVKLDYEIKRDLYADLARTWQDNSKCPETVKEAVARRHTTLKTPFWFPNASSKTITTPRFTSKNSKSRRVIRNWVRRKSRGTYRM